MGSLTSVKKWRVLGLIGVLALAMVAAAAIAGALVSNQASAHGGDVALVHACVNNTNAEVRIAHPGPGNENADCTALGANWSNVHLDDDWTGAGTGSLSPASLTDNVGIGTSAPTAKLHLGGFSGAVDGTKGILMTNDAGTVVALEIGAVNDSYVGTNSESSFHIRTRGQNVITASGFNGNVGIGTTDPIAGLHFDGDRFILTANSSTEKSFINMNPAGAVQFQITGGATARFDGNGDVLLGISPSGNNVGIGTTTPQSALQVSGYIQLDTVTGAPPAGDCDAAQEHGRMKVDAGAGVSLLYICTADGWVSK